MGGAPLDRPFVAFPMFRSTDSSIAHSCRAASSINASSPPPGSLVGYARSLSRMTLLGWMHRKLRSNNDVFKDFNTAGGGACNCITGQASPDHEYLGDDDLGNNHSSPPVDADDLFTFAGSGLLTIGTLGFTGVTIPGDDDEEYDVDVYSSDGTDDDYEADEDVVTSTFTFPTPEAAVTPTFTFPEPEAASIEKAVGVVEAIAEKDDDTTTEDDLMLVSAELEKVLGGSAVSDVPSARVSFALGVDCPLQGFLFGSPVSSDAESRPDKRDSCGRRASLGELFMRTRFAEEKVALVAVAESEDGSAGGEREETTGSGKGRGGQKTVKNRKVKDEKGAGGDGAPANSTTKSKFQKILQIFHRKVYPESSILTRNLVKKRRKRSPDNGSGGGTNDKPVAKQRIPSLGCCTNGAFSASPDNGELNGNKSGHWIKTDADYLVLEL